MKKKYLKYRNKLILFGSPFLVPKYGFRLFNYILVLKAFFITIPFECQD